MWGVVGLAGDVALETTDYLGLGQAFGGASGGIGSGALVVAQSTEYDDVEGVVGSAVTSAVELVSSGSAAAGRDGCAAAQVRERSL